MNFVIVHIHGVLMDSLIQEYKMFLTCEKTVDFMTKLRMC